MSSICLCVTDIVNKNERSLYQCRMKRIAEDYGRGISFSIGWCEPIVEYLKDQCMIINLSDYKGCNNCEMLMLPDGWTYGEQTNAKAFSQRMEYLQELADVLIADNHKVEFYIGLSGTNPDEFLESTVKQKDLIPYLYSTVGQEGAELGTDRHVIVVPNE